MAGRRAEKAVEIGEHAMNAKTAPERATLRVEEAAALLGISRNGCYDAIARKEIPIIRLGRKILIARRTIERMLGVEP
jgi:excisionase family DNA binding protein